MKTFEKPRVNTRPQAGDRQNYPLHGEGVWTEWAKANDMQHSQARHLDRAAAVPGALLLVAISSGRTLRVLPPAQDSQAEAA